MNGLNFAVTVTAALVVGIVVCIEIGLRAGWRLRRFHADAAGNGTIEAAILGLLGLTLALSFSGASDRLTQRRTLIVQEANAIGTAWLRLDLLNAADQPPLRAQFRSYLDSRIDAFEHIADRERSAAAMTAGAKLQRDIWSAATAACPRASAASACMLLLPALNDMFDITTTRSMARLEHLPPLIIGLLVLLGCVGGVLVGYTMSAQRERNLLYMVLFTLSIAATVYVVLDLEFPRAGLINVAAMDQAIVGLRELMRQP